MKSNVTLFIIVSWFLGLCGTFDVLTQPSRAFREAEHSKSKWLGIEVLGTLLSFTGIFTWGAYSIWVRPSVVRAGGRRRRKGVFFRTFFGALAAPAPRSSTAPRRAGSASNDPHTKQSCSSCGGSGHQTCFACQGRGRISSPAYASAGVGNDNWCSRCSGSGQRRCDSCSGSGTRSG